MSTLFGNVLKQALNTFDRSNQSSFIANFKLLKQLTDQLTFHDINLNSVELFSETDFTRPSKAPCTFVHVFENADISMSVFIMRPDYTMPLHDHPMMYGILKCFYGKLLINSFSQVPSSDGTILYDKEALKVKVTAENIQPVDSKSECVILTPKEKNYHEISAIEGVAAFFDILSPPYDANMPIYGRRKCKFYRKGDCESANRRLRTILWLERIPTPISYCCDSADVHESVTECCDSICSAWSNSK